MQVQPLAVLFLVVTAAHCEQLRYALFTAGPGLTGPGFDSSGAVPAIELAEEMINADSSILPGYNLTHTPVINTLVCLATQSIYIFAEQEPNIQAHTYTYNTS